MIIFLKEKTNQALFKKDLSWGDFCQFTCTAILVPIQFSVKELFHLTTEPKKFDQGAGWGGRWGEVQEGEVICVPMADSY